MGVDDKFIRLSNVVLHYPTYRRSNRVIASGLNDVSLEFKSGDRVALIGVNGAGKSTLLKVLAGVYPIDSGEVDVSGDVFSMFGSGIGIKSNLSGYENVSLRGLFYGIFDSAVMESKIQEVMSFSELGDKFYQPVSTYSSGMKARLAFSMILMINPDILLIDEALGTGDVKFLAKTKQYSKELISKANIVVQASHSERFLKSVCNKALWLDKGRVFGCGEIDDVYRDYNRYLGIG